MNASLSKILIDIKPRDRNIIFKEFLDKILEDKRLSSKLVFPIKLIFLIFVILPSLKFK